MTRQLWPYQSLGVRTRVPLVLLHGFMGSGEDWRPLGEAFAGRFTCILPDLPGHGRNLSSPRDAPLTFERVATELVALLDRLSLERVHLAGYSMGGRIALYTAIHFPGRVATLCLESANPGIVSPHPRRERAALDDRRASDLLAQGLVVFIEHWYQSALFQSLQDYPDLLSRTKKRRKRNDARWMAKVIRELSPGRQEPLWDRLGELKMPVLLVTGERDAKYAALLQKMHAAIPNARLALVPGAGHNTHLEKPNEFLGVLADFLPKRLELGQIPQEVNMTEVIVKRQMQVSADLLWETLKGFDLNYLGGFAHKLEGSGVGATRTFDSPRGETKEKVESLDEEARTLTYTIVYGTLPVENYHATIRVHPGEGEACELEWAAVFEPRGVSEAKAREIVEGLFKMNMKALDKHHS